MELIYDAFKTINNDSRQIFNTLYPFTTENIKGYIDSFDLNNKSLLTVGSSGDQVINAILYNSKDITVLDICPFTEMYYDLKVAGILSLDREEFANFFSTHITYGRNPYSFNLSSFNRIKDSLRHVSNEAYEFWNTLFTKYDGYVIRTRLFNNDEHDVRSIIKYNDYLSTELAYETVRNHVLDHNVKFIKNDVLHSNLPTTYDNIWLSNITAYLTLENIKKIFLNFLPYLNDDGKMLLAYLYDAGKYENINPHISNSSIDDFIELLGGYSFDKKTFDGVNPIAYGKKDAVDKVLIYQKKN